MRLPEVEHCNTVKSVDQLGRAPATESVRVRGVHEFWVLHGGFGVLYGFLLSWFVYVGVHAFWDLHGGFVVLYGFLLSWYVD